MNIEFLGTGTSHGIPVAGCICPVCTSSNPKNNRYRSSVCFRKDGFLLLVDISPEFRLQAVRANLTRPDAVLITHSHNDHIGGLDDIRIYSFKNPVHFYASSDVCMDIRERFSYIFKETQKGGGKPQILLNEIKQSENFNLGPFKITPLAVKHGELNILGYRINNTAYITDASFLCEETLDKIKGLDLLILNSLRYRPHSTHFNVDQALAVIEEVKPKQSYLTHICHDLEHEAFSRFLPLGVKPAYDGLCIDIP